MWKLWAKLFGWKYVHVEGAIDSGIRRVHTAPNGIKMYKWLGDWVIMGKHYTKTTPLN